jgi:hypothetical protein
MSIRLGAFRVAIVAFVWLSLPHLTRGQRDWRKETSIDRVPRILFDASIGSATALGYKFPSTSFGSSVELPIGRNIEIQASTTFSPDKKFITNDGHSVKVNGTAIGWITNRFGLAANVERSWLWTSQFEKRSLFPSAGIVLRNDFLGPGRLYISYLFPKGCVWATATNPCKLQSNRLHGVQLHAESRGAASHIRVGVGGGFYRFCDQANPHQPSTGRICHFAATAMANLRFEFHFVRRHIDWDGAY